MNPEPTVIVRMRENKTALRRPVCSERARQEVEGVHRHRRGTGTIVGRDDLTDAARLTIRGPRVTSDAGFGDSIAVNGVCLTVVEFDDQQFTVDVMAETLRRSSLDRLGLGSSVNLERAMRADGRFGGHIVQGTWTAPGPSWRSPPPRIGRSYASASIRT